MSRSSCLELISQCKSLPKALELHTRVRQLSSNSEDVFVANKVLDMYGKCGSVKLAKQVFDGITARDCFSWVLLLCAYTRNGHLQDGKNLFDSMPAWNLVAWTALLTGFASRGQNQQAKQIFDLMPERDLAPCIIMLTAYAQSGELEEAERSFAELEEIDLCVCNAMISAYARNRHVGESRKIFDSMPERDLVSWNAILAAYAQNGLAEPARRVFITMPERDAVSWTSRLSSYAQGGGDQSDLAFEVFGAMNLSAEAAPDDVCFISVLLACSHTGVIYTGWSCFTSMINDFGVRPVRQHYSCIVSLLCKAGYLAEAEDLLCSMPFVPSGLDWRCFLGACRGNKGCKNSDDCFVAGKSAIDSEPSSGSSYVLLSDIYRGKNSNNA